MKAGITVSTTCSFVLFCFINEQLRNISYGHMLLGYTENIRLITGTGILSHEALSKFVELFL